ncbi:MAG: hypothetical protein ACR2QC_00410 [Gammaproteobacteria bacterium]
MTKEKIARCPHCGHDEFIVNVNENKRIRLVGLEKHPYLREEEISSEGREYAVVVCGGCMRDLDESAWMDSVKPECFC